MFFLFLVRFCFSRLPLSFSHSYPSINSFRLAIPAHFRRLSLVSHVDRSCPMAFSLSSSPFISSSLPLFPILPLSTFPLSFLYTFPTTYIAPCAAHISPFRPVSSSSFSTTICRMRTLFSHTHPLCFSSLLCPFSFTQADHRHHMVPTSLLVHISCYMPHAVCRPQH